MLTGRSYADLEIPEGKRRKVGEQLERYCGQDTEGMIWMLDEPGGGFN